MINHIISRFNFALLHIKRSLFNYDDFIDETQTGALGNHDDYNPPRAERITHQHANTDQAYLNKLDYDTIVCRLLFTVEFRNRSLLDISLNLTRGRCVLLAEAIL